MFHRFIVSMAYSASSFFNQSSRRFPRSRSGINMIVALFSPFSMSVSTPVRSANHSVVLCCLRISISCLLLSLFVLWSQQYFLPSMFPFFRQLWPTYFLTLTCSMPLTVSLPCIHLAFILFPYLLFFGNVFRRLSVSLVFALFWVLF